jgi:glycosyltransferase involved in cell wall biosynthesis
LRRIAHIITGLNVGGAEMMLLRLLERTDRARFTPEVFTLIPGGALVEKVHHLGIPVHSVGMARGIPNPASILRLAGMLRRFAPDVVQTWLYHGDFIGGLAARLAGVRAVSWCIQSSDIGKHYKPTTMATVRLCAAFSRTIPQAIVSVSESGRTVHGAVGYDTSRFTIIPNGFDLTQFRAEPSLRPVVRAELEIGNDLPLIGIFARFDPQKDYENFVAAAAILTALGSSAHFLMAGKDVSPDNRELMAWIDAAGIRSRTHLLGLRDDTFRLMNATDLCTLSSRYGEALPLAIGEAMACEIPCVVTDVGDAALLTGETGKSVPPADPEALARAWHTVLEMPVAERKALGKAARERIAAHYEIGTIVARYEALHDDLANRFPRR